MSGLGNFLAGVGSGIAKGIDKMAEESREQRKRENITQEEYDMLKKRVQSLEAQMKTAMELIGMLQKQHMTTDFEDIEPEEPQEVPAGNQ